MPIQFSCPKCGTLLLAQENAIGLNVRCPSCREISVVPDQASQPETVPENEPGNYQMEEPGTAREEPSLGGEARRPCPMCGEMILANAVKCRFCGEIFDETLRKAERKKQGSARDATLTGGDIAIALLCMNIGCIVAIVYMVQGKPKGIKMLGLNILAQVIAGVIYAVILAAGQH
jgi:DNA-directed RNA polymerase subunit M/transcription elongation factor TFIIS